MYEALIWLLAIEVMGVLAFPITFGLFSRLPDRGAMLAKPLVLLLCAYVFWILGHIDGVGGSEVTVLAIVTVLAGLCVFLLRRHGDEIVPFVRSHWRVLLAGEMVFLFAYGVWVAIVAQSPDITNTEKPMDFAFLNAVLQADHFPPEDPWLAGHSISYYYFGHVMVAFLTKLTGISSAISFNLGAPLIAAMAAAGVFSLVYNLVRLAGGSGRAGVLFGLAGPLLLVFIGSLEGVMEFAYAQGWGSAGFWRSVAIPGLEGGGSADGGFFPNEFLWWWRASRIMTTFSDGVQVDAAITEFPFFIFLLGDLHAHAMSLPFLVLNLALALNIFVAPQVHGRFWGRRRWWEPFVVALALGSLGFINLWDFPVFAGILLAVLLVKFFADHDGEVVPAVRSTLWAAAPILVMAVLLFLPFYLSVDGRAPIILPLRDVSTRPLVFALTWGLFLTMSGGFLLVQFWRLPVIDGAARNTLGIVLVVTFGPFLAWTLARVVISPWDGGLGNGLTDAVSRFGSLIPLFLLVGAAFYSGLARSITDQRKPMAFVLVIMGMGLYLLMGVELFYLDDLFFIRLNTVFKAYFQAWLLLVVVCAFGLYYVWARLRERPRPAFRLAGMAWGGLVAVLLVASLYYPIGSALDRADASDEPATLDGLAFLEQFYPSEYQAVNWLRKEARWGRVVEAVGGDYTEFARVSAYSGFPTLLGWPTHEEHWRGGPSSQSGRRSDVDRIYNSTDLQEVQALLAEYQVRYVFVGPRELVGYPEADLNKFDSFMVPHTFEGAAPVTIYELCSSGSTTNPCS